MTDRLKHEVKQDDPATFMAFGGVSYQVEVTRLDGTTFRCWVPGETLPLESWPPKMRFQWTAPDGSEWFYVAGYRAYWWPEDWASVRNLWRESMEPVVA